jgi:hypothetical protein
MCGKPHIALAKSNKIIVYSAKLYYDFIKSPNPNKSYAINAQLNVKSVKL